MAQDTDFKIYKSYFKHFPKCLTFTEIQQDTD